VKMRKILQPVVFSVVQLVNKNNKNQQRIYIYMCEIYPRIQLNYVITEKHARIYADFGYTDPL